MGTATPFDGSTKITDVFGYWPTFHDAEVHEIHLDRGHGNSVNSSYVFPILTVKIHVFEMTDQVNSAGYYVLVKHTLVTLRFHGIDECRLDDFNHQNAILGLTVSESALGPRKVPVREVRMEAAFGLDASFKCEMCEVVAVEACDEKGRLPPNTSLERTREG
jgi:hypothetical protein